MYAKKSNSIYIKSFKGNKSMKSFNFYPSNIKYMKKFKETKSKTVENNCFLWFRNC